MIKGLSGRLSDISCETDNLIYSYDGVHIGQAYPLALL